MPLLDIDCFLQDDERVSNDSVMFGSEPLINYISRSSLSPFF